MTIDADVIPVGLGVGGEFVAGGLAEAGLDVVGIESALVAVRAQVPVATLSQTIYAYPTFRRAIEDAITQGSELAEFLKEARELAVAEEGTPSWHASERIAPWGL